MRTAVASGRRPGPAIVTRGRGTMGRRRVLSTMSPRGMTIPEGRTTGRFGASNEGVVRGLISMKSIAHRNVNATVITAQTPDPARIGIISPASAHGRTSGPGSFSLAELAGSGRTAQTEIPDLLVEG